MTGKMKCVECVQDEAAFQDCTVDVDGLYTSDDITQLKGKSVLTEGNEIGKFASKQF